MILLVEGQRPIFGGKLRYHTTEPFKAAAAYASRQRVDVPHLEFEAVLPVPAITPGYDPQTELSDEQTRPAQNTRPATAAAEGASAKRVARSLRKGSAQAHSGGTERQMTKKPQPPVEGLIAATEGRVLPTAGKLKSVVEQSLARSPEMPPTQRKSIQDILAQTIPDPVEIGLE